MSVSIENNIITFCHGDTVNLTFAPDNYTLAADDTVEFTIRSLSGEDIYTTTERNIVLSAAFTASLTDEHYFYGVRVTTSAGVEIPTSLRECGLRVLGSVFDGD